jgi:hypothetical protein
MAGLKGAAAKLGIPRQTLESKIKTLAINKSRFKLHNSLPLPDPHRLEAFCHLQQVCRS